jgi:hypothetical protein
MLNLCIYQKRFLIAVQNSLWHVHLFIYLCVCNAELMTYAESMYFRNYVMLNLCDIYAILLYLWYSVPVQSLCYSISIYAIQYLGCYFVLDCIYVLNQILYELSV